MTLPPMQSSRDLQKLNTALNGFAVMLSQVPPSATTFSARSRKSSQDSAAMRFAEPLVKAPRGSGLMSPSSLVKDDKTERFLSAWSAKSCF